MVGPSELRFDFHDAIPNSNERKCGPVVKDAETPIFPQVNRLKDEKFNQKGMIAAVRMAAQMTPEMMEMMMQDMAGMGMGMRFR